jgi:electron transfer flavoprotein alpha subunit
MKMKPEHSGPVWVIGEIKEGRPCAVSLQLAGKARSLADALEVPVEVLLLGDCLKEPAAAFIAAGADRVFIGESPDLDLYQSEIYGETIVRMVQARQPQILLIGSTFMGRELAPLVAARLHTGLTAHCLDLVLTDDQILDQQIPAYGGLMSIYCPERRPQMATVAPGVFPTPAPDNSRTGSIESISLPSLPDPRVKTLGVVKKPAEQISLSQAPRIVAGGAGAGDEAGWNLIKDFAAALQAALGCTRPAVDAGWADLETMIGQSGKMVSPQVYIGVGLSGELQHMVGIKGARIMAAVNNDPKSPIFEQVDYGVIEDLKSFLPLLIEKIKARREKQ